MDYNYNIRKLIRAALVPLINEGITISKKEFDEVKSFLERGGILENESVPYQILIRKDGDRVFFIRGEYKFFKNTDAFIKAAIRTIKRGY